MSKKRAHCLMHVPFEGLGYIENYLVKHEYEITFTQFYNNDFVLPEVKYIDFLVIMGGPMSVYEENDYLWLTQEKAFIRKTIDAGKKVLGICLGSQLIAEVLGAKVYPNNIKEIGWYPIFKTETCNQSTLFADSSNSPVVFHWHGDTYDLPNGCEHLFYSTHCKHQAFVYKNSVVGLQFHLETTEHLIFGMLEAGKAELTTDVCIQSETEISNSLFNIQTTNLILQNFLNRFLLTQKAD